MFNILAAGPALLASLLVSGSAAPAPPPDGKTTVDVVYANGSGCPPGALKAVARKGTITIAFEDFTASSGGDALDYRKNCQVGLNVKVPKGYTYAVSRVTVGGTGKLGPGDSGSVRALMYFQGMTETVEQGREINGPLNGKWQFDSRIGPKSRVYHPCGAKRYLNVNLDLRAGSGDGSVSVGGRLGLEFTRKKC
ncbi:hypothetical protein Ait01nite_068840 [Actinoplanes italicus]|uniref:Uncharacterized protein DUF4360 n=1 Tax=Actinoplanes italicus TaxID=113567 RepID=A0A2T0K1F1_9ACTN|nr:DUF4360 domain-containing protein [Actinoplanes italicus]PRX16631.1 uncharacterized protein DUF4360 [Actinoplanes italicus]GIE33839.1 hypothetical protein Ait01nite_068840 [Actinoplanes italicus]